MEKEPVLHTKWCGKHWIHLDEVTSTNDYLKQGDFPDGTAVIADRQTAGKGRQGKTWSEAPVGQAMYLSVLFPSMKTAIWGYCPSMRPGRRPQPGSRCPHQMAQRCALGEKKVAASSVKAKSKRGVYRPSAE